MEVISVRQISKSFRGLQAVDGLSFAVPKGEVYGFLGQNGAGKSTTIRMLLTLVRPDGGSIALFGRDLHHHRREVLKKVGAVIEKPDLYKYLTAYQNLSIMARLSGRPAGEKALLRQLDQVGLSGRAHSRVATFSQGMKQRLGIACALIHQPELIILDEPTNGLDPQGIADIRNLVLHLSREEGRTVFVSSHLLSEIETIADSMLIIDGGKKVVEGRVSDLLNPADTVVTIDTTDNAKALDLLQASAWAGGLLPSSGLRLRLHKAQIPALVQYLAERGSGLQALTPKHSLEDYFLSLTTANQHVAAYPDRAL